MTEAVTTVRTNTDAGWQLFAAGLAADIRLWLWCVALLFGARVALVFQNLGSMVPTTGWNDRAQAFWTGFRFDVPIATVVALPSVLMSCLALKISIEAGGWRVRQFFATLFTVLWLLLTVITLGYFREYHNQFDVHLLGVVYDDFGAVLTTIWKTYPVIWGGVGLCATAWVLFKCQQRWLRVCFPFPTPAAPKHLTTRVALGLLLLFVLIAGFRGSVGRRPMQRKDAARTSDLVLNRCVMNAFTSLRYAIKSHRRLMGGDGLRNYLGGESPLAAFREYAGRDDLASIEDSFLREALGVQGEKPSHIFVVVMESYDGWTLLEEHAEWNISNELKALGRGGIQVGRFLPGSHSTMTSLATIIGGLADAGVITNERLKPGEAPLATAIAPQMKRLGYRTNLFYAGFGSWQRIEDFCMEQGFDETFAGSEMGEGVHTNEWGISDRDLFAYIKTAVKSDVPSFNLIMTSTNHRPYDLDLEAEGCPLTEVPPQYAGAFSGGNSTLNALGHHWYSDHWLGDFVREVVGRVPGSLFAITGDHWGRGFPGPRPTNLERATVPLVLYGPDVLPPGVDGSALSGSHLDLGATLIELAAPRGFTYHAIGRDILRSQPDDVASSRMWIIGRDFIAPAMTEGPIESFSGRRLSLDPVGLEANRRRCRLAHGISWWRLRRGNILPRK